MNAPLRDCTVLPFPAAASARLQSVVKLLHLDRRPFASTGFLPGAGPGAAWAWIVATVAHELDCDEDAVHCEDQEDGCDVVTVDGLPCYIVEITRPIHLC